jgi:hypothetical protein
MYQIPLIQVKTFIAYTRLSQIGKEPAFLRALDDDGEVFVVDVHRTL